MADLPSAAELSSAAAPLALGNDDHVLIRFVFERKDEETATIEMVFRNRQSHESVTNKFHGVKPDTMPPIASKTRIAVLNERLNQWGGPRDLRIIEQLPDGSTVLFWAASVQSTLR